MYSTSCIEKNQRKILLFNQGMGPIKLSVSKHCKIRHDKYDISGYIKTTRYSLDIKKQSARKFECILTNFYLSSYKTVFYIELSFLIKNILFFIILFHSRQNNYLYKSLKYNKEKRKGDVAVELETFWECAFLRFWFWCWNLLYFCCNVFDSEICTAKTSKCLVSRMVC